MRGWKLSSLAALAASVLVPAQASTTAGAPIGPAFTVDTVEDTQLVRPSVAANAAGGSAVAWYAYDNSVPIGHVRVRRFSALGQAFGPEQAVADGITPQVAMSAGGNFVVVFLDPSLQTRFSLYDPDGVRLVNAQVVPNGGDVPPNVGMDADGRFVIAGLAGNAPVQVVAQRYTAAGVANGSTIVVGDGNTAPDVAVASNGRFVVTYTDAGQVKARVFDAAGAPVTALFRADTTGVLNDAKAAMDGAGNFVVFWSHDGGQLIARFFAANGTPQTGELQVATVDILNLAFVNASMSGNGETAFVWDTGSGPTPPATSDIFLRRYDKTFAARDANPVKVNAGNPHPHQVAPSVALDADGDFIVVWQNGDANTVGQSILGQRFVGPEDVDLGVTLADSPDPAVAGEAMSYTIGVTNHHAAVTPIAGATPGIAAVNASIGSAHNVLVTATLPTGVANIASTSTGWSCQVAGTQAICAYQDILAPAGNAPLVLTLTTPQSFTSLQTTASVSGYQLDTVTTNNTDSEMTASAGASNGTVQAANGQPVSFSSSRGTLTVTRANQPSGAPDGLNYPLGFFHYEITGVTSGSQLTLTVQLPAGTNASDWIDCPGATCFRVSKTDSTAPGNVQITGDTVTVHIQDNGPGDDDPRPGIVAATVAPVTVKSNEGGALSYLVLLPLFGAAGYRRRRVIPASR